MERFFLNPWSLALSALAGGIVLLYMLKLRRQRVTVGSTLLWESSLHDYKANAPWQKLRSNLLMILQIIAILLLSLALARPFLFGSALTGGRLVLIVDTSASMLAKDENPDRLGRALAAAASAVSDMGGNDEAMLIGAGPQPRVLQSFTRDKLQLEQALSRLRELAGGEADLNSALRLASSIATGSQGRARVLVLSDGAIPDIDSVAASDLRISYFPVGKEAENAGIVSAGARRQPLSDSYEVFAAIQSFLSSTRNADLTLRIAGDVVDVRSLELTPGRRSEVTFSGLPYTPEPVELRLEYESGSDLLAVDDSAFLVLPKAQYTRVGLASASESVLLRKVLASMPDVDLYSAGDAGAASAQGSGDRRMDVWVVEGNAAYVDDPAANYLFINTSQGSGLPVEPGEEVQTDFSSDPPVIPSVVGTDQSHPVLRFAGLSDLRLSSMRRVKLQPWARSIVEASEGPLIVEGERNGQRSLYLAFDIYRSDLPLRAAFPIFMANALNSLGGGSRLSGQAASAGTRVDITAPSGSAAVAITEPGGTVDARGLPTRSFTLSDTVQPGIYRLDFSNSSGAANGSQLIPVSLVSYDESNIAPAESIRIKGGDALRADAGAAPSEVEIEGRKQVRINREFYSWLIGVVLLLIALEWFLYHTRAF